MMTARELLVHADRMQMFLAEAEMARMARLVTDTASSGPQSLWSRLGRLFGSAGQNVPAEMRTQQCSEPCC